MPLQRAWTSTATFFETITWVRGTEYQNDGGLRHNAFVPDREPFTARCIHCHNTYPYEQRLYAVDSPGLVGFHSAPKEAVKKLRSRIPISSLLDQPDTNSLPTRELVTVGISCESCHFGGREHSKDVKKKIRFVLSHPLLAGWTPDHIDARKNPIVINAICRQCHFSTSASWPDGSAMVNSMESLEQDHARPAGDAWLSHPDNMVKVVAGSAYARSPKGKVLLPRIIKLLDEPNAYTRTRMLQIAEMLKEIPGR